MIKENIVSLVDGFTVELNPKVRHKLKSIPLFSNLKTILNYNKLKFIYIYTQNIKHTYVENIKKFSCVCSVC